MIRFTWKVVSDTQIELTARDGVRVIKQRFDKAVFWLEGESLQAKKRACERELVKRMGRLG